MMAWSRHYRQDAAHQKIYETAMWANRLGSKENGRTL
jgi:hypothetical protein